MRCIPKAAFLLALLTGCAPTLSASDAFDELAHRVHNRLGREVHWQQGTPEDAQVQMRVDALLQGELAVEDAVQVGLFGNRSLQALYEELGVSQAEVIAASTIRNPILTLLGRWPLAKGVTSGEVNILQAFLDIFLMPLRRHLAEEEFRAARLRVTQGVFDTAYTIRTAYYRLQGSLAVVGIRRQALEEVQHSQELAILRRKGVTPSDLETAIGRALYEQLKLDLARDEMTMLTHRETLTREMGLSDKQETWRIPVDLPPLPSTDPTLAGLEALALASRYDLAAAQADVDIYQEALDNTRGTSLVGEVYVGGATSRDAEGTHVAGPTVALELPIFNRRQAAIARLSAQLQQAKRRAEQVALRIRSEVREAQANLSRARRLVEPYKDQMVPLRRHILDLAQARYDSGTFDPYQLLLAKQAEVMARIEHIDALRDYWLIYANLEHSVGTLAVGNRLP